MDTINDQLTRVLLEEGIKDRIHNRRWYRAHRWGSFASLETENIIALRALLTVRSAARRAMRQTERRDARWIERRHEGHRDAGDPDCNLCVAAWDFYGRVTA